MTRWILPSTSFVSQRADAYVIEQWNQKKGQFEPIIDPLPSLTRSTLKQMMLDGHVTINGQALKPNSKIQAGSTICICFPEKKPLQGYAQPLSILYEDEHILVVNKPPNMVVHPSPTVKEPTLVEALIAAQKKLSPAAGDYRPGIVHRIDKDTSGALMLAKTDQAYYILRNYFSEHKILRQYEAFCYGKVPDHGTIESLIARNPHHRLKMSAEVQQGKQAITHYKTLHHFSYQGIIFASKILATLETGRTHQVRVHMSHIGHSLLNDPLYGSARKKFFPEVATDTLSQLPGQALHAAVLSCLHPITGATLHFNAPMFPELRALDDFLQKFC